jgi:uncharacterized protein YaiL (DUF2058 family)
VTSAFALFALVGMGSSTALAIWLVVMRGDLAKAELWLRDERTARARADARADAAEAFKAADAATIARLKRQLAELQKARNDAYEHSAQSGAVGGGAVVDSVVDDIRSMYPDADSDG